MIVRALSAVYGAAATWRRRWYLRNPARRVRLARPVVSVGNLRVGGSGKTPAVMAIARILLEQGERPCVLSRGYKRRDAGARVTVVSDGHQVLSDVAHAGDEPLLLARSLPGVPVVVCADRHAAGLLAESRFSPTVHLLDDGFQHVRLWRDIDLLMVDETDLADRVLPAGRLREPLANGAIADAVLVQGDERAVKAVAARLHVSAGFRVVRTLGRAMPLSSGAGVDQGMPIFAIAGIAKPDRFFDDLRTSGWRVAGTRAFPDHHWFDASDISSVVADAAARGAAAIVTTTKDAVRLESLDLSGGPFACVPLHTAIEPAQVFTRWLMSRLDAARRRGSGATSDVVTTPSTEGR